MAFWDTVYYGNTVADWAIALAIVIGFVILSKVFYWVASNVLKGLTAKTKSKIDDILIDMLEEPIMLGIVIFGIWFALSRLTFGDTTSAVILKGFHFLITLNVTWLVARVFNAIFVEYVAPIADRTESDFDDQILPIIKKSVIGGIWILGVIVGLDNVGYEIGPILAGLGIGGLALAMAAKDTVANVFGGVMIFVDKPFKLRDRIKIEGFDGFVEEIGLRSTRLRTLDGTLVTIPNSTFSENPVENVTLEPSRKVMFSIGLVYDTKPEKMEVAMEILKKIANDNSDVDDNYRVSFTSFGDFSLGILFLYYIKKGSDILETQNQVNLAILREFNKNKLEMAFPTQTIELKK